ncbi:hypothetical protein [Salinibius halmophilus]|uniref:hypothetical protein n=1 Tax=Salinibius halmophilus TaxID=1853216 RepID=UPI000E663B6F|nr:hypothetical protein [Salinibius halmophilus]
MMATLVKRSALAVIVLIGGIWAVSYSAVNLFDSTLRIERIDVQGLPSSAAAYQHAYEVSQYPAAQLRFYTSASLPDSLLSRLRMGYGRDQQDNAQIMLSFTEASVWQLWQNLYYRNKVIAATSALSAQHLANREQALAARPIADQVSNAVMSGDTELLQLRLESLSHISTSSDLTELALQFAQFDMAEAGKAVMYFSDRNVARFRYDYVSPSLERAWLLVDVSLGDSLALAAIDVKIVQDGQ